MVNLSLSRLLKTLSPLFPLHPSVSLSVSLSLSLLVPFSSALIFIHYFFFFVKWRGGFFFFFLFVVVLEGRGEKKRGREKFSTIDNKGLMI